MWGWWSREKENRGRRQKRNKRESRKGAFHGGQGVTEGGWKMPARWVSWRLFFDNEKSSLQKGRGYFSMCWLRSACMVSRFSHVQFFGTAWTVALQAPLLMEFSRQEYWSGLPFPPGDLSHPGIEPISLMSPALAGGFFITSATWEALIKELRGG